MSLRLHNMAILLTALLVTSASSSRDARAEGKKPFKIFGAGLIMEDTLFFPGATARHFAVGYGSYVGKYVGWGVVQVNSVDFDTFTGEFSSAVPFRFASVFKRDVLAFHYGRTDEASGASPPATLPGIVSLEPAENGKVRAIWLAEFNPVPDASTGRFASVKAGSFIMLATTEPFTLGATDEGIPFIPKFTAYSWYSTEPGYIEFDD